jgi:hypothetical protein
MQNFSVPTCKQPSTARSLILLACACAFFCGGCFSKKRPTLAMSNFVLAHPVVPPAGDTTLADAPELSVEEAWPVPRLVVFRGAPAKPRVVPAPARETAAEEKPSQPLMAPEISDEQLSAAKSATQQSLSAAERNLNLTQGKTLNAAQQDVVSKIMAFLDSAREAMKNSDWQRARIQAKKAEVLSQEFAPNP